jgi:antitoxin ParD1/3/4
VELTSRFSRHRAARSSPPSGIREALRLLKDRDELKLLAVEDLRREIQKGLDQLDRGESVPLDAEHIKSEGRRRLTGR